MGGRDLALGIGALRALSVTGADARPWVALAGMADTVDAGVTLLAFRRLPTVSRWGILASTLGAALVSFRVAGALDPPIDPADPGDPADAAHPGDPGTVPVDGAC